MYIPLKNVKRTNQFAERIKYLREKNNWSKTELVEKLSIKNLSTYANWEYALREPDLDTVIEISKLYGVSVDFLLGVTDDDYISKEFLSNISNKTLTKWYANFGEKATDMEIEKLYKIYKLIKE